MWHGNLSKLTLSNELLSVSVSLEDFLLCLLADIQLLEHPIPARAHAAAACHKNRQVPIAREPRVS